MDRRPRLQRQLSAALLLLTILLYYALFSFLKWANKDGWEFQFYHVEPLLALLALLPAPVCLALCRRRIHPGWVGTALIHLLLPCAAWSLLACLYRGGGLGCRFSLLLFSAALVAPVLLFANAPSHWSLKLASGVCAVPPLFVLSILLFLFFTFWGVDDFGAVTATRSLACPDGVRTAEVMQISEGALGGCVKVVIPAPEERQELWLGERVKGHDRQVYSGGRYSDYDRLDIYWADETTLVINGTEYDCPG